MEMVPFTEVKQACVKFLDYSKSILAPEFKLYHFLR
jgi:hypothetical protein